MTNFEKWKANLAPEYMATIVDMFNGEECVELCPVYGGCNAMERGNLTCKGSFVAWANEEAT